MSNPISYAAILAMAALAGVAFYVHPGPVPVYAASYKGGAVKGSAALLRKVDAKKVCMINDQYLERDQIPVEVDGKTYYGCCPMCKARLKNDPATRYAIDPVSGKKVDKALAVIGVTADGTAYYFENESNLERFSLTLKRMH